jgi:hypothetical protein
VGVSISVKKNVKCGSAAQAFSLAIFYAIFHIDIMRGFTGVKVIGIIGEGGIIGKGLWRVHG